MGDTLKVDGDGLRVVAKRCEVAATALSAHSSPPVGSLTQATAAAVVDAHERVGAAAAVLARRAGSTAKYLRIADGVYRTTDGESARNLGAVNRPVQA